MYIRVHFNESENIVWDSIVKSYILDGTQMRDVVIDKGRTPLSFASPDELCVSIEDYPNLHEWISTSIDEFKDK